MKATVAIRGFRNVGANVSVNANPCMATLGIIFSSWRESLLLDLQSFHSNVATRCIEGGPRPVQSISRPDNRDRCRPDNGFVCRVDRSLDQSLQAYRRFQRGGRGIGIMSGGFIDSGIHQGRLNGGWCDPGLSTVRFPVSCQAPAEQHCDTDPENRPYNIGRKTGVFHWLIFIPGIHKNSESVRLMEGILFFLLVSLNFIRTQKSDLSVLQAEDVHRQYLQPASVRSAGTPIRLQGMISIRITDFKGS